MARGKKGNSRRMEKQRTKGTFPRFNRPGLRVLRGSHGVVKNEGEKKKGWEQKLGETPRRKGGKKREFWGRAKRRWGKVEKGEQHTDR